jgi:hypothetical protein
MRVTAEVDHKVSDAELIGLLRGTQEELKAHGELNQVNLLLHDFARELLKQRLQLRVRFVRLVESSRLE